MSLINFPFVRLSYPSLGNPAYVDDIVAANQMTLDAITALLNGGVEGFAIISGLAFSNGSYSPGVIMFQGTLFQVTTEFAQGLYLMAQPVGIIPRPFSDTNNRPIYTQLIAVPTNDSTGGGNGATPVFNGPMNQYRFDLNTVTTGLQAAQATIAALRGAAFLPVGTTSNTVAAGDDSRFGYSIAAANTLFATKASVLLRGNPGANNTGFVPTDQYDPATKLYVDTVNAKILVRSAGPVNVGDVPTGGITVTASFGQTLASTSYMIFICVYSNGDPHNDTTTSWTFPVAGKLTTGFQVRFQEWNAQTQNLSFDWFVLSY